MTEITRLVELTMNWHKLPKALRWPRLRLIKGLPWPRQRLAAMGLTITVCWTLLALFGPWLVPYDPLQGDPSLTAAPPSLSHPFGLDKYGRDVLARVVAGGRYDLFIAVVAVGLAVIAGTVIGSVSGFIGGGFDNLLMRLIDMVLAFPSFVLALVFVAVLDPTLSVLVVALSLRFIPMYARLVRGEILSEKLKEYAMAARAIGCSDTRLVFRHLLPNSLSPIITQSTMNLSWAILNAAGLSFLGLGVQPPTPEWGVMISEGSSYIVSGQWWMSFFPGTALMLMTAGFILIGDGINARHEGSSL
jgi:peptide/nickel transport system permease protein